MNTTTDSDGLEELRHSAAHLLAAAIVILQPNARPTIGPATEDGFYYDFDLAEPLSLDDLPKIESTMRELVTGWTAFAHETVSPDEARQRFATNPYKLELIDEITQRGEPITLYTAGGFTDLCRGGHVESPKAALKHFKLLKVAGAYWRGDETKTMLTRIYGTAFTSKQELDEYFQLLEEAKKRDHRKLGRELDLFTFSPLVGPGLPLFTPRGTIVREELTRFIQELQQARGYQRVLIPHLAQTDLYKTSGHWEKFSDDIFHVTGKHDSQFVLKPMNCPHHTQIYASRPRSYRELPQRYSEVTMMYRDEQAGQLSGLSRVRAITVDDAHVFCTPEQVPDEIDRVFAIIEDFYAVFDFTVQHRLSLWDPEHPEKYLGTPETWETAQATLRSVLQERNIPFAEAAGEAAFYGPKIDFLAQDSLKRTWQLSTIQLDFNLPERFELTYTDATSKPQRTVMIHRAISGSLERFMAILLEHYNGALPLWLSPTHVVVLTITDEQAAYGHDVVAQLTAAGIRAEIDDRSESIGRKIREAQMQKVPVMLIIGKKEAAAGQVSLRLRTSKDDGSYTIAAVINRLHEEIAKRS